MPGTASGQSVQRLPRLLGQISFKCLLRWALKKILVQSDTRIRTQSLATRQRVRRPARALSPGLLYGSFRTINGSSAMIQILSVKLQTSSTKLQSLESFKHQASSFRTNLFNRQAASIPTRVTSVKLQAWSYKLIDPRTMVHGYWRSFRGARTKGLC